MYADLDNSSFLRCAAILMAGLAVGTSGCGPKQPPDPNRTTISGVVTLNGNPLPGGTIMFESKEGHLASSAAIGQGGVYATSRAPLGENEVSIETASLQYGAPNLFVPIPDKYADPMTSGFTVNVKPGKNENVNFELKK